MLLFSFVKIIYELIESVYFACQESFCQRNGNPFLYINCKQIELYNSSFVYITTNSYLCISPINLGQSFKINKLTNLYKKNKILISNHISVLLKFNRARSVCISSVNQWLVNIDNKLSQFQIGHITNGRNKVLLTRLVAMQLLLIKMFSGECFFMTCLLFKTNLNIIRYTCTCFAIQSIIMQHYYS